MSTPPDSQVVTPLSPEPVDYTFETDPEPLVKQVGDSGDNHLMGHDGRNSLRGLDGDDILVAKGGRDYLEGGRGDDILSGGGDGMLEDRFAFGSDDTGPDSIIDFVPQCEICIDIFPGPEGDRIVLLGGRPEDIAAVTKGATASPDGGTVLHYGETTITLAGVDTDRVAEDWFLLA